MERTYWFNIDGTQHPNAEAMLARLLDEDILFCNSRNYFGLKGEKEPETLILFLNCNDCFVPASDAESVTLDELPKLFALFESKGDYAAVEFIAHKRGQQPRARIKDSMVKKGFWTSALENLKPNTV